MNAANLKPWKSGQSGNPGGMPKGTLNRLRGDFVQALAEDFRDNGKKAIEDARAESPLGYIKVVASLLPKELELKRPLDELSDDELAAVVAAMRAIEAAQGARSGTADTAQPEPAPVVQALPETG